MKICVEFFGSARLRTEVAKTYLVFEQKTVRLSDLVVALTQTHPGLSPDCFLEGKLQSSFALNINGERFVRDLTVDLYDGDSVLIMSADAGG